MCPQTPLGEYENPKLSEAKYPAIQVSCWETQELKCTKVIVE